MLRVCLFLLFCDAAALQVKHGGRDDNTVEYAADFLLDTHWQIQQMDDLSKDGHWSFHPQCGWSSCPRALPHVGTEGDVNIKRWKVQSNLITEGWKNWEVEILEFNIANAPRHSSVQF
jgi:hypothetical protein